MAVPAGETRLIKDLGADEQIGKGQIHARWYPLVMFVGLAIDNHRKKCDISTISRSLLDVSILDLSTIVSLLELFAPTEVSNGGSTWYFGFNLFNRPYGPQRIAVKLIGENELANRPTGLSTCLKLGGLSLVTSGCI